MKKHTPETLQTYAIVGSSLPATLLSIYFLVIHDFSLYLIALLIILQTGIVSYSLYAMRQELGHRLRSLTSVVEGILHGDHALKARPEYGTTEFKGLVDSVNLLGNALASEKIQSLERQSLLEKLIAQLNIGVITATEDGTIDFINTAAKRIFDIPAQRELIHLSQLTPLPSLLLKTQLMTLNEQQDPKKVFVQVDYFIGQGLPKRLILLTDMGNMLRQEEFKAWENLVRVISHEINNSMASIASLGDSIDYIANQDTLNTDDRSDISASAKIICDRAQSITHFVAQYKSLSNVTRPELSNHKIGEIIDHVVPLFKQPAIVVTGDKNLTCTIDGNQIKQVLINIIKNAQEAQQHPDANNAEGAIGIFISTQPLQPVHWLNETNQRKLNNNKSSQQLLRIDVIDNGCGIHSPKNLFIPFYTTKPSGSGIGLALSRQIIELHQGSLGIFNREDNKGCCVRIELPL